MNASLRRIIVGLLVLTCAPAASAAEKRYEPKWASLDQRPTPEWFLDAKFGVFIHWGVYSVPAWGKVGEYAEWYWNRLFNESPCKDEVVVNDRWGKDCRHKHGGYWTTEYAAGLKDGSHPWEESRGMAYSYGLNRAERIDDYKTGREFILTLIDLVSRGGNLLLDIGPAGDGTIPPLMEQRLLEIGDWLKVNGEAIYGTRFASRSCQWTEGKRPDQQFGEFMVKYNLLDQVGQQPKKGIACKQVFFTKKPDALYAITPDWPGKQLVLRKVKVPASATVTMLGVDGALKTQLDGTTLTITLPDLGPEGAPCRHAFAFKIPGAEVLSED